MTHPDAQAALSALDEAAFRLHLLASAPPSVYVEKDLLELAIVRTREAYNALRGAIPPS